MTVKPHLRLTWGGTLGSNEIWTCSLSMRPDDSAWSAAANAAAQTSLLTAMLIDQASDDTKIEDIGDDLEAYHGSADAGITRKAVLKWHKLVAIGEDGKYAGAPVERAHNLEGGGQAGLSTPYMPHQCSRKITLITNGDMNRVKGGWYNPAPATDNFDFMTDLYSTGATATVAARTEQLIADLENVPGLDTHSFRVVVSSAGRHNRDGSVRVGPALYDVQKVGVGRRVDIQRRRANKVLETPSVVTVE